MKSVDSIDFFDIVARGWQKCLQNFPMDRHDAYQIGQALGFALKAAAKHDLKTEAGRDAFRQELEEEAEKSDVYYVFTGIIESMY